MRSNRHHVFETIRNKRQWHTPPDPDAAELGFRGWHSRGYLPHFDMPGLAQFINYRLDDAMPAACATNGPSIFFSRHRRGDAIHERLRV